MRIRILTFFASGVFAVLLSLFSISTASASNHDPHVPVTNLPVCSYLTTYTALNTAPAPQNWGDVLHLAYQSMGSHITYSEIWVHDVSNNHPAAFLGATSYGHAGDAHVDTAGANPNVHAVYEMMFIHTLDGHHAPSCRSNAHYVNLMPAGGHPAPAPAHHHAAAHHVPTHNAHAVSPAHAVYYPSTGHHGHVHTPRHGVVIEHHGHHAIDAHYTAFHGVGLYQGNPSAHHHAYADYHHAVALYDPVGHAIAHELAAHETAFHGVNLYNNNAYTHHGNAGLAHTTAPVTHHFSHHTASVYQPAHVHHAVPLYHSHHGHHAPAAHHHHAPAVHHAPVVHHAPAAHHQTAPSYHGAGGIFAGHAPPVHYDPHAYVPVTHLYGQYVGGHH